MPVFTLESFSPTQDMNALLAGLTTGNISAIAETTANRVVINLTGGTSVFIFGSGLSATNTNGVFAFGGTMTGVSITFSPGGVPFATLSGLNTPFTSLFGNAAGLLGGDDTVNGNGTTPLSLYGYGGNDVLTSTDSTGQDADSLYGGEGDDRFQIDFAPSGYNASIGPNDAIFGGGGTDTLWLNMPGSADLSVVPTLPQGIEILRITSEGGGGLLDLNGTMGILNAPGLTGIDSVWAVTILAPGTYDFSGLTWTGLTLSGFTYPAVITGSAGDDIIIGPSAHIGTSVHDYSGGMGNDTITGNASNERIYGGTGLNRLTGAGGNDTLNGGDDADVLFGGTGIDQLSGGQGADTLSGGDDADTINGENGADSLLGGNGDDAITGDSGLVSPDHGNDTLNGGAGADTLQGAGGNDTYVVDANDTIIELAGEFTGFDTVQIAASASLGDYQNIENLTLTGTAAIDGAGNSGSNIITGNAGANYLAGGGGEDTLQGAGGNDTYLLAAPVTVIEALNAGTDTAISFTSATLATNVERLILLGDSNINGTGNATANRITGNDGNNRIDGGAAADRLIGAEGDDTYVFTAGDVIVELEDEGTDTVESTVTVTLAAEVENLLLTGAAVANGTGNTLANRITGNTAANTLNGGEGIDTLIGGAGNDTYLVDNAGDVVTEAAGDTDDTVRASVTFTLVAGSNIETLAAAAGTVAIDLTGNALAQDIVGNGGVNVINGLSGADTLTGGSGADTFVFSASLTTTGTDVITDFSRTMDVIHLQNSVFTALAATGGLAATAFVANATGLAGDTGDRIIYETDTGLIRYDSNGSTAGGTQVTFARLQTPLPLDHTDFLVI